MTLFFMISHSLSSYESLFLIHAFGDTKDTETHIILVIIIIKMWHHNKHIQREEEKVWKLLNNWFWCQKSIKNDEEHTVFLWRIMSPSLLEFWSFYQPYLLVTEYIVCLVFHCMTWTYFLPGILGSPSFCLCQSFIGAKTEATVSSLPSRKAFSGHLFCVWCLRKEWRQMQQTIIRGESNGCMRRREWSKK